MNNTYFILRHGQTSYQLKKEKIIYPWPEPSPILLSKKGKEQIETIAEKLKKKGIDLIFSSDLPRTCQSAKIVAETLGLKIIFDKQLREINLGVYRGRPRAEYIKSLSYGKERFYKKITQGESWNDVRKRVMDFINEIDKKYKNKKILIVSHGNPLWLLEGGIKGWNEDELLKQKFQNKTIKTGELRKLM